MTALIREVERSTNAILPSLPQGCSSFTLLLRCFVSHILLWDRLADLLEAQSHLYAVDKTVDIKAIFKKEMMKTVMIVLSGCPPASCLCVF